jgi:chemotaxis family two-component system response regulator Rcp1
MDRTKRPLEILLVEDNPADAHIIMEMLRGLAQCVNVTQAKDGQQAVDILLGQSVPSAPVPEFVILDLNLPKVDGFHILSLIQSRGELSSIPVVVMTGSLNREDEARSRSMGVVDYLSKPGDLDEYEVTCRWFKKALSSMTE